jgi:hypothetical protein
MASIDELKPKINPLKLGEGVRLFDDSKTAFMYELSK